MKQRGILLFCFLSVIIFFTRTSLFAQGFLPDKKDWYRPDYAASDVDTVKICSGIPVGQIHCSDEITMLYNKQGYLTYYEKTNYSTNIESGRVHPIINPKIRKSWTRNLFTYDVKMRLIKISFKESISKYPEFNIGVGSRSLKKNGGFLPDYYEKEIQRPDQDVSMKVNSINFKYDSKGAPVKQTIYFIIYGISNLIASHGNNENYLYQIKYDSLILNNHNSDYYSKLGIVPPNYISYQKLEQKYVNCFNQDLGNKLRWSQPFNNFLCPEKISSKEKIELLNEQKTNVLRIHQVYDYDQKLILEKNESTFYYEKFNCATVSPNSYITNYKYDNHGYLKTKTNYLIYNLKSGSQQPKPFCEATNDVLFILNDSIFTVKTQETNYSYNSSGLLIKEESISFNYSASMGYGGYHYTDSACKLSCFKLEKQENKLKFYSYTFHPEQ